MAMVPRPPVGRAARAPRPRGRDRRVPLVAESRAHVGAIHSDGPTWGERRRVESRAPWAREPSRRRTWDERYRTHVGVTVEARSLLSPAPTWARDRSCPKRPTRVRPAERLSEHVVEVRNELRRAGAQILERSEAGALEQAPRQDGEPDLDLVQPRTVARRVDEANPVGRVFQKRPARLLRLEDAGLALGADFILDPAPTSNELDECCGTVC